MKEYLITSGFFDRPRKLILANEYVLWENNDLKGKELTKIKKSEISDIKHGSEWIVWYKFTVGRRFSITFKDHQNNDFRIRFSSLFNTHPEYLQMYADIVADVWRFYLETIVKAHLDIFYTKHEVEISRVRLTYDGIFLPEQNTPIPWEKAGTKEYYRYFAIYHEDKPNIHYRVGYNEYGTETLWSTVRTIMKQKQNE